MQSGKGKIKLIKLEPIFEVFSKRQGSEAGTNVRLWVVLSTQVYFLSSHVKAISLENCGVKQNTKCKQYCLKKSDFIASLLPLQHWLHLSLLELQNLMLHLVQLNQNLAF